MKFIVEIDDSELPVRVEEAEMMVEDVLYDDFPSAIVNAKMSY